MSSALPQGRYPLAGLLTLPLLPAHIAVRRDRPVLAPHDRFPLATGRALDAPLLDRHDPLDSPV